MDKAFPDWMMQAYGQIDGTRVDQLWKGAEEARKLNAVAQLAGIEYFWAPESGVDISELRTALRKAETTAALEGQARQTQFLVGGMLAACIEKPQTDRAEILALAMITGSVRGRRQVEHPPQVFEYARKWYEDWSEAYNRPQPRLPAASTYEAAIGEANTFAQGNNAVEAVKKIVDGLTKFNTFWKARVADFESHKTLLFEENELLWRAITHHSESGKKQYKDLEEHERPLLLACDMASAIKVFKPGAAIAQLLKYELDIAESKGGDHELKYQDCVTKPDKGLVKQIIADIGVPQFHHLTPFVSGLDLVANGGTGWSEVYQSRTGLSADQKLPASEIAYQFLLELTLLHLIANAKVSG